MEINYCSSLTSVMPRQYLIHCHATGTAMLWQWRKEEDEGIKVKRPYGVIQHTRNSTQGTAHKELIPRISVQLIYEKTPKQLSGLRYEARQLS